MSFPSLVIDCQIKADWFDLKRNGRFKKFDRKFEMNYQIKVK